MKVEGASKEVKAKNANQSKEIKRKEGGDKQAEKRYHEIKKEAKRAEINQKEKLKKIEKGAASKSDKIDKNLKPGEKKKTEAEKDREKKEPKFEKKESKNESQKEKMMKVQREKRTDDRDDKHQNGKDKSQREKNIRGSIMAEADAVLHQHKLGLGSVDGSSSSTIAPIDKSNRIGQDKTTPEDRLYQEISKYREKFEHRFDKLNDKEISRALELEGSIREKEQTHPEALNFVRQHMDDFKFNTNSLNKSTFEYSPAKKESHEYEEIFEKIQESTIGNLLEKEAKLVELAEPVAIVNFASEIIGMLKDIHDNRLAGLANNEGKEWRDHKKVEAAAYLYEKLHPKEVRENMGFNPDANHQYADNIVKNYDDLKALYKEFDSLMNKQNPNQEIQSTISQY